MERLRLLAAGVCGACLLLLAPLAQGASRASLTLYVSFFANGTISVTLPDGSQLGTTSGQAPVIPAGYYTLVFSGPGGCTALPYFHLTGPGTNIVTNMAEGTAQKATNNANLLPSSTYSWSSDAFPNVLHTFSTSAVVEGAPPSGPASNNGATPTGKGVTYPDIVGSAIVPFRGTLTAAVSTSGRLSLAYKGKSLTQLKAGRYTISVTDRSANAGFVLRKVGRAPLALTSSAFMGAHSSSVRLTAGKWLFGVAAGRAIYTITVS